MTRAPRAAVLVTGTEIMIGRVQDRNSGFLARELERHGVVLERVLAVDDHEQAIRDGLTGLLATGVELVITSGGLGPTHDDRTVAAVAAVAGRSLVLDRATLADIDERTAPYARERGLDPALWAEGNRKQATVPEGAAVLPPVGTAPGLVVEVAEQRIVVLPGPPAELARMWADASAHPLVRDLLRQAPRERRVLRVYGVGESSVANDFAELGGDAGGTETTICAARMELEVLVRYPASAAAAAERLVGGLRERLGPAVYAEDERPLEAHVVDGLRAGGLTLATAESCTAGLVAARVANVPGASDVLLGGVVAYADDVKRAALGVPAALLEREGAVSAACARAMADGARQALGADVAVAVTGVAGPGGGTEAKPVGLVYVCAVGPDGAAAAREHRFGEAGRETIREWSVTSALHLVRAVAHSARPVG